MLNGLYNWAIKYHDNCAEGHDGNEENTGDSDKDDEEEDDDVLDEDEGEEDDDDLDEDEGEDNEQEPDIHACRPICWLHGPAGAGKSAIMQSLCQRLQDAGRLGGAFFFKRGHATRGKPKVLFATLAYQLAEHNRDLRPLISHIVEDSPSIVARHMDVQLHKLIVEPCHSLINSPPLILLIDGLDECETQDSQAEILRLVGSAVRHHPKTFQFLIASRPEAHIREIFNDSSFDKILDSVNVYQSFKDIQKYFNDQFARIYHTHGHTMVDVPTPWPSLDVVDSLVEKSSGYFVYASTVIKFIDDKYSRPTERLASIQDLTPTDAGAPFEALDQLYTQILSAVPIRFHSQLLDILQHFLVTAPGVAITATWTDATLLHPLPLSHLLRSLYL
ncbi:NACHT domain-containing protein [Mycena olivaceomarginata]|nr:NACHT domain-containing protein [Mycena olivaceomarginata]